MEYDGLQTHTNGDGSGNATAMRSGWTTRYHTTPELGRFLQNDAEHSWRVAMIIYLCNPLPTKELIYEAIMHDTGEIFMGDFPGPTGAKHPEVRKPISDLEKKYRFTMGIPCLKLTDQENEWLKFADIAECVHYMRTFWPRLELRSDWKAACQTAYSRGLALKVDEEKLNMILNIGTE